MRVYLKGKNFRKQINVKFNNTGSADENNGKISRQQFLPSSEVEIQGPLHPSDAHRGYSLAWCHSLQLPSTQPETVRKSLLLHLNPYVFFKKRIQL
jgi:hypothetical protein